MEEVKCPQCEKLPTNATYRLVQDACGHRKCRMCLLQDEDSCRQCRQNSDKQQSSVITKRECDTLIVSNRETAGNRRPSEEALIDELSTVSLKTAGNGKTAKKAEVAAMKRSYQTIVIPNHISVLKDPVSYKCNVCNKVFVTKSHIKYHMYCEGGKFNWLASTFPKLEQSQATNLTVATSATKSTSQNPTSRSTRTSTPEQNRIPARSAANRSRYAAN